MVGFLEAGLVEDPLGGIVAINFRKRMVGWAKERRVVVDEDDGKSNFLSLLVCEGKFS